MSRAMRNPCPRGQLPDLGGRLEPLYLSSAKATVINFWATWCVPCLCEIPELTALNASSEDRGIRLVGVAVAFGTVAEIQNFATSTRCGTCSLPRTRSQPAATSAA